MQLPNSQPYADDDNPLVKEKKMMMILKRKEIP